MHQILQLLTIGFFAGSACAVYYVPGPKIGYPSMGKRAFYTNATGNRYPLMGRRSSPSTRGQTEKREEAVVEDGPVYNKRGGVFTQGPHRTFPRVGRSGTAGSLGQTGAATVTAKIRSELLRTLAERLDRNVLDTRSVVSEEASIDNGQRLPAAVEVTSQRDVPLTQFLFLILDSDGDGRLTKQEFTSGMEKVLDQNVLC